MNKIIKVLIFPVIIIPMCIMAYVGCIMTWGLTSFKYNFDFFWNDYWDKEGK